MIFHFRNAYKKAIFHRKVYWYFILQVLLAYLLFSLISSARLTLSSKIDILRNDPIANVEMIVGTKITDELYKDSFNEFNLEDHNYLEKTLGQQLVFGYTELFNITCFNEHGKTTYPSVIASHNILKLSSDGSYFELKDKIVAPESFIPDLIETLSRTNTFKIEGIEIVAASIKDKVLYLSNGEKVEVESNTGLFSKGQTYYFTEDYSLEDNQLLSKMVLIPVKYKSIYSGESRKNFGFIKKEKHSIVDYSRVINYFSNRYPNFHFDLTSRFRKYVKDSRHIIQLLNAVSFILILISIIVLLGIVGNVFILISNRRKQIATSYAIGNRLTGIILELVMEQSIILLLSGFSSIVFSLFIQFLIQVNLYNLWKINYVPLFFAIPISLFIAFLVCLLPFFWVKKIDMVQLLNN